MEDRPLSNDAIAAAKLDQEEPWSEQFLAELNHSRQQAEQLLGAQLAQIDGLESSLAAELRELSAELAASQSTAAAQRDATERETARLQEQAAESARLKADWTRREAAWEQAQQEALRQRQTFLAELRAKDDELEQRARNLQSVEAALRQSQRAQQLGEEDIATERERHSRLRKRIEEQVQALEADREALAAEEARTKKQRRRIARRFKEKRAIGQEQLERRQAELHSAATRRTAEQVGALETAQTEAASLRLETTQLRKLLNERGGELVQLREELRGVDATSNDQLRQASRLRDEVEQLRGELSQRDATTDDQQQLSQLRSERDQLRARLAEAQEELARGDNESERQKREDFQRRFEMAVADVRELKRKNADLEEQLAHAPRAAAAPTPKAEGGRLDWESQKRRLLEALENDPDDDEEAREERLTIEGTIRITDEVIAQKDKEIAELQELLNQQSAIQGSMAVGAAAIGELFNNDELIVQQRERLCQLESEWEAKLRQAEIDISRERAKLARDRAELEEKLLLVQQSQQSQGTAATSAKAESAATKGKSGRWLARLGLKEQAEEE